MMDNTLIIFFFRSAGGIYLYSILSSASSRVAFATSPSSAFSGVGMGPFSSFGEVLAARETGTGILDLKLASFLLQDVGSRLVSDDEIRKDDAGSTGKDVDVFGRTSCIDDSIARSSPGRLSRLTTPWIRLMKSRAPSVPEELGIPRLLPP